jgi:hypothetical protein
VRLSAPTAGANKLEISASIAGAQHGSAYDAEVQVGAGNRVLEIQIDPAFGLKTDPQRAARLHGVPSCTGGAVLRISVLDRTGNKQAVSIILQISANPRSLWKNLASDPAAAYPKAPYADAYLDGPVGSKLLGVSTRGRMHANVGGFREDDFRIAYLPHEQCVLIAADGAGSAPLAREGSRIAVSSALAALSDSLQIHSADADPAALLARAARAAFAGIQAQAEALGRSVSDFNTTLLIAMCSVRAPHQVAALQIGDGLIAAQSKEGAWSPPLCDCEYGEYHGQTHFLSAYAVTDAELHARIRVAQFPQLQTLLVATDGIVDAYFETESALLDANAWRPFAKRLATALSVASEPARLVSGIRQMLEEFTPGHHDDRTIALALWPQ